MELLKSAAEIFPVNMRIDLCGSNAFVSQHFLHRPQICAPFDEVGGKGMSESMGGNIFANACSPGQIFDHEKDHYS